MPSGLRILGVTMSAFLLLTGIPANLAAVDFAAAKSYPVGASPAAVAVGDFNGDGKPDIAVANTGSSNVSILLGNGDGTFQPAMNFNAGDSPRVIAVGDFNGDGKLDLAAFRPGVTGSAGSVSILLGNGDGTFQAPKTLALSESASAMVVADFNLDRKSDVAVYDSAVNNGPATLNIYLGNGDGAFQPAKQTALPSNAGGFSVADFNGDSKPDVAAVMSSGILILLGNGDGTFSQGLTVTVTYADVPPNSVVYDSAVPADLNHDDRVDLLISSHGFARCGFGCSVTESHISLFLGNGNGSFQGEKIAASGTATGNALHDFKVDRPFVGDFNGDGQMDLAYRVTPALAAFYSPYLRIQLGNGDGTFSSPLSSGLQSVAPFVGSIAAAHDLTADHLTDLIALGTTNDIEVLLNTSLGKQLSVALAGSGSGFVTSQDGSINCTKSGSNSGGNCSSLYLPGTSVSLTAAPAAASVFGGWSGACSGADPGVCSVILNSDQAVTATFNLHPPDFTVTPASTTFTTQTGAQVTDALILTGQYGFSAPVTLTCAVTGPAPLAACSVSPSPVTLGSTPGNSTLTMTAPATLAAVAVPLNEGGRAAYAGVLPFSALLLGAFGLASPILRKRRRVLLLLAGSVIVLSAAFVGCGGGGTPPPPMPKTYMVTVSATSGTLQHSTTVTLVVQ